MYKDVLAFFNNNSEVLARITAYIIVPFSYCSMLREFHVNEYEQFNKGSLGSMFGMLLGTALIGMSNNLGEEAE
jgi:hypothetical protein